MEPIAGSVRAKGHACAVLPACRPLESPDPIKVERVRSSRDHQLERHCAPSTTLPQQAVGRRRDRREACRHRLPSARWQFSLLTEAGGDQHGRSMESDATDGCAAADATGF